MCPLQAKKYFKDQIHDTCKIRCLVMPFFETENQLNSQHFYNYYTISNVTNSTLDSFYFPKRWEGSSEGSFQRILHRMVRVILKKRKLGHDILSLPLPQIEFKTNLKNKFKTNFTFK